MTPPPVSLKARSVCQLPFFESSMVRISLFQFQHVFFFGFFFKTTSTTPPRRAAPHPTPRRCSRLSVIRTCHSRTSSSGATSTASTSPGSRRWAPCRTWTWGGPPRRRVRQAATLSQNHTTHENSVPGTHLARLGVFACQIIFIRESFFND